MAAPLVERATVASALGCGAGSSPFGSLQNLGFGAANQWNLGLSLQQNIYTGGRLTAQYRAANAGKRSAAIGLTAAKAQLTLDVTQAYYDAQLADQLVQDGHEARRGLCVRGLDFTALAPAFDEDIDRAVLQVQPAVGETRANGAAHAFQSS